MNWETTIVAKSKWIVFGVIPLMAILMHIHVFPMELRGVHAWRQTETTANVINFAEQDFNILNPRVHNLHWEDGVKRMEFPLMQWLMACFYKVFGEHIWIVRILTLLIGMAGVWGMYRLGQHFFQDEFKAVILAWCFAWSPAFFYYSVNPLPDNFALMSGIWGLSFFMKWYRTQKWSALWISAAFLMLATLTKLPFVLFFAVPFGYALGDTLRSRFSRTGKNILVALPGLICLGLPAAWYISVIPHWHGNGVVAGIFDASADEWFIILKIFVKNGIWMMPGILLNYGSVIFFVFGLWYIYKEKLWKHRLAPAFGLLAAGVWAYYLFEINMITTVHDYYMFPFLPGMFLIAVFGFGKWMEKGDRRMKTAALILLLLLPVVAGLIAWPRWKITVSESLFTHREELRAAVPQEAKVFAGENISPHIYLYHLDKKGWHIAEGELNPDVMRIRVGQGGEYLYNDDPALESHPVIAPWLDTLVAEIGDFRIWKLKKPEEVPVAGS